MPLLFDMPLEKLYEYQGTNPRPDDFDAFWNTAVSEARAVDPRIELIPAEFKCAIADCFHLYYTSVNGARIHAKLLRPKNMPEPHPAVLMFHGYSVDAGDWVNKLGYVAQGYTVAAMDCRGQGGLSEDNGAVKGWTLRGQIVRGVEDVPEKLYYRQVFLDTAVLARIMMEMPDVDANRVGAMGNSQGGGCLWPAPHWSHALSVSRPCIPFSPTTSAYGKLTRFMALITNCKNGSAAAIRCINGKTRSLTSLAT